MNGRTEAHLVQFRAVPSLLTACTNQPLSGKEAGLPSNRCRVRSASVSWAIWLWLFSGSPWGSGGPVLPPKLRCGAVKCAPRLRGCGTSRPWQFWASRSRPTASGWFPRVLLQGGMGRGAVAWLKGVGDDRRIQMGLEWTRGGVGELQCGVAWSDFLAVGMSLPVYSSRRLRRFAQSGSAPEPLSSDAARWGGLIWIGPLERGPLCGCRPDAMVGAAAQALMGFGWGRHGSGHPRVVFGRGRQGGCAVEFHGWESLGDNPPCFLR